MKQIFPKEIVDNTAEVHQFRHSTKSKIIYTIFLLALVAAFIALPIFKVKVYTTAPGIIKPDRERTTLTVINSGKINFNSIKNNKIVNKGDTLLIIDNNGLSQQLELTGFKQEEIAAFCSDLVVLLDKKLMRSTDLSTPKYQRVYIQYDQKLRELNTRLQKIKIDYTRNIALFDKGVIAKAEYQNSKLDYDLALGEVYQFKKQQENTWQADLTELSTTLKELRSNEIQLVKSKTQYVITAPVSGTLLNVKTYEIGGFISSGMQLAEISPDTDLLVECFVNPKDIGLLKKHNKINFQIDAYNYNQWGMASGEIVEIGNDIELIENQPVFKVRCKLNQSHLALKNGFQGNLKKGMTLSANFELTERSLYDLLYDKMDDWLNPNSGGIAKL
ncbi:HlyD family secretion protein [Cellulophaga baltica]|uniref:HlyD family secretion protein n=1 Tax=Cellulophaga baltica TaxID=76594 RepID=UPI000423B5E6|nr:HlyD family efflux transporter periplasmic adaptor subunit [Cellulophaga baltica]AIY12736.1 secretion protein HlyD [Cellulophaga baltica NN016038]